MTHYSDVIMSVIWSQITSVSIVYSTVCWGANQRKHHSSASPTFMGEIHQWPVNSPHKRPVTRKIFPFYDVIMLQCWSWPYRNLPSTGLSARPVQCRGHGGRIHVYGTDAHRPNANDPNTCTSSQIAKTIWSMRSDVNARLKWRCITI